MAKRPEIKGKFPNFLF